jgi:hypothetical protein
MNKERTELISKFFRLAKLSVALMLIAFAGQQAMAQGTRGTIRGTVKDPNQAVVANATVRLVDKAKGTEVRTAQTGDDGNYQFIEIEPSTYNVIISAPNFAEARITDVTVEPNRNLVLDANLSVGSVTNEVTVTAGTELIDHESPTLGSTVENRRIQGLPLNGRNVLNLALLQPGVFPTGGTLSGLGIRVNGSRGTENNVTLDGANNNEVAVGGVIGGITRPDAVQEFRLLTSNFEPEFGRNTGSIINVVTRSGTNNYHGNVRFFYRPTELSASNYFLNSAPGAVAGVDHRQPFERKELGFNIGGPVFFPNFGNDGPGVYNGKDKTFFFADYERRWQKIGGSATVSNLPSAAERAGNFSGLLADGIILYDPATATLGNPGGNPFPGNIIPLNRFSPIAQYYLGFLPNGDADGRAVVSNNNVSLVNYFTGRLDHNFTPNHLLNFTYNYNDSNTASGQAFQGTPIPGFGETDLRNAQNYVTRYTTIFNSNIVNTFLFGFARNDFPAGAPVNTTTPAQIGFTADFVASAQFAGPPRIFFYDRGFDIGNGYQGPQTRLAENYQFQDSLSWVVGDHRMKFGFDVVKYKQAQNFLFINNGALGYSAVAEEGSNTVGDDFADFLIGNTPIDTQFGSNGERDFRQKAFAGFTQDTWRATKNLTLSYGVRYEYVSPLTDTNDRVAYYRPGSFSPQLTAGTLLFEGKHIVIPAGGRAPNGLAYVGDPDNVLGGTVPRGGTAPDRNNFAPRVGFAYSFDKLPGFLSRIVGENQTAIRGGIGQYYGAVVADTILQQLTATGYSGTNAYYYHGNGTLADPFGPDPFPLYRFMGLPDLLPPGPNPNPFTAADDIVIGLPLAQFAQPTDPNLKTPVVTQWNLTVERSFFRDYVLGLSYVGNIGRKLYVQEQINPAVGTLIPASARFQGGAIPTPSTGNAASRRANADIPLSLAQLTTKGRSRYDAFEVNFQKRFSDDGLGFQVAYTFSKSLNDADTQRGGIDILDQDAGWARSSDDYPHRFVASAIYDLPFFNKTSGFVNRVLDGWSLGAIFTYQSGSLFSVVNPIDTVGTGGGVITFADIGQAFTLLDPKTNNLAAFNANAFAVADCRVLTPGGTPVAGQNFNRCINADGTKGRRGSAGRNQFRLDNPINNWDIVMTKKTRLWNETSNLELRFEAFNLLNYTQFTTIDLNFQPNNANPNFGHYTASAPARSVQLGARISF